MKVMVINFNLIFLIFLKEIAGNFLSVDVRNLQETLLKSNPSEKHTYINNINTYDSKLSLQDLSLKENNASIDRIRNQNNQEIAYIFDNIYQSQINNKLLRTEFELIFKFRKENNSESEYTIIESPKNLDKNNEEHNIISIEDMFIDSDKKTSIKEIKSRNAQLFVRKIESNQIKFSYDYRYFDLTNNISNNDEFKTEIMLLKYKANDLDKLSLKLEGVICSIDIHDNFLNDCIRLFQNRFKNWIIIAKSQLSFEKNQEYFKFYKTFIQAIIISKELENVVTLDNYNAFFSCNAIDIESMIKYDVSNLSIKLPNSKDELIKFDDSNDLEKYLNMHSFIPKDSIIENEGTYFFEVFIQYIGNKSEEKDKSTFVILTIVMSSLTLIFSIIFIWYVYIKMVMYYTQLQRYYTPLPIMLLMISLGLLFEILANKNESASNFILVMLTDVFLKLVNIIFKTFLWILLILISFVSKFKLGFLDN